MQEEVSMLTDGVDLCNIEVNGHDNSMCISTSSQMQVRSIIVEALDGFTSLTFR